MKTPTTTQNMYAITHHAKFGNCPLMSAMRDATKVMSHASCSTRLLASIYPRPNIPVKELTYVCNRNSRECERVTDNMSCNIQYELPSDVGILPTHAKPSHPASSSGICFQIAIHLAKGWRFKTAV